MEARTRKKIIKGFGFLPFRRNLSNKYGRQLLNTATKIGLDASKSPDENFRNVEKEYIILEEKKYWMN